MSKQQAEKIKDWNDNKRMPWPKRRIEEPIQSGLMTYAKVVAAYSDTEVWGDGNRRIKPHQGAA